MKIDILLSTFNGAAFLDDLILSLTAQTVQNWRLCVRDDGSSDDTLTILKSWQEKEKDKILIFDECKKHLGPKKSFEMLLSQSDAEIMMFCDQDDVWLPDKIEKTTEEMQKLQQHHPGKPALVFTDLKVVDETLKEIASSFWKYMKIQPQNVFNIYTLLANNPVVGCTMMINKPVKSLVLPFPEQAVMHDWWIALNVTRKGVINYVNRPTLLYRLHRQNSIGAIQINSKYYAGRLKNFSKTISQNKDAVKMLKALGFSLSPAKFWWHKMWLTISKFFKR